MDINFITVDVTGDTDIVEQVLAITKNPKRVIMFVDFDRVTLIREGEEHEVIEAEIILTENYRQVAIEMAEGRRGVPRPEWNDLVEIARKARTLIAHTPPGNLEDMGGEEGLVRALIQVNHAERYATDKANTPTWWRYYPHARHTSRPVWAHARLTDNLNEIAEKLSATEVGSFDYTREPTSLHTETIYATTPAGGDWEIDGCTVRPPAGTRVVVCSTTGTNETWKAYTIK